MEIAASGAFADMRVTQLTTIRQLESYLMHWRSLHSQTPGRSFFHTWAYFRAVWESTLPSARMRVLVAEDEGRPVGILPLLQHSRRTIWGAVEVIEYPRCCPSAFAGPVGPQPAATLMAGFRYFAESSDDWDLIDLQGVHPLFDRGRTRTALSMTRLPWVSRPKSFEHACVNVTPTWPDFESRRADLGTRVSSAERRLGAQGAIRFARWRPQGAGYGEGSADWDLYVRCLRLAQQTAGGNSLSSPLDKMLALRLHAAVTHCGAMDVSCLFLDERLVAFCHAAHASGELSVLHSAVADDDSRTVLLARMLADSCRRGDQRYYLGELTAGTDRQWVDRYVNAERFQCFARTSVKTKQVVDRLWNSWRRIGE